MRKTLEEIQLVAKTDCTILLIGENGTGKDYLARYLQSPSRSVPPGVDASKPGSPARA
jgi:transcriptional regulator with GAF, ATPase, and Fis domain